MQNIHNYHILKQSQNIFDKYPVPDVSMHCTKYEKNQSKDLFSTIKRCKNQLKTAIIARHKLCFTSNKPLLYLISVPYYHI